MIKFETGKTYSTRSSCNYDCIFSFTILKRTTSTVWVKVYGEIVKRRIKPDYYKEHEIFYPFGKYSMCPIIRAKG